MYENRDHVRDITTKVRSSTIEDEKARFVASRLGKQKASLFHLAINEFVDREYERIMQQDQQLKRG
tara:strand:+ start:2266 stop:2463 length:198 start_codon:yes stop_codon:yes gene_type:complete